MLLPMTEVKVNPVHTKFIPGAELLGFVPVLNSAEYIDSSVSATESKHNRVVPVFGIPSPRIVPTYSTSKKEMVEMELPGFIFEVEENKLKDRHKETAAEMKKNIADNPYVLFFMGEKSHQGMRFKDKNEALELMSSFDFFDELVGEPEMLHIK